ncbi:Hypothetical_protein [Hexamita inflata]|uniref:Hypothetical_protein n=1 Tax=Hexamita inflata TaxID=28002 RepID=A0AA86UX54_9EUKA|nr:Hypothetical protein HINF_LOCUS63090 [Hexamita inflata]
MNCTIKKKQKVTIQPQSQQYDCKSQKQVQDYSKSPVEQTNNQCNIITVQKQEVNNSSHYQMISCNTTNVSKYLFWDESAKQDVNIMEIVPTETGDQCIQTIQIVVKENQRTVSDDNELFKYIFNDGR